MYPSYYQLVTCSVYLPIFQVKLGGDLVIFGWTIVLGAIIADRPVGWRLGIAPVSQTGQSSWYPDVSYPGPAVSHK